MVFSSLIFCFFGRSFAIKNPVLLKRAGDKKISKENRKEKKNPKTTKDADEEEENEEEEEMSSVKPIDRKYILVLNKVP